MKAFGKLLLSVIIFAVVGYLYFSNETATQKQTPPAQQTTTAVQAVPPPVTKPKEMPAGPMTPQWPPTSSVNSTIQLDDLLTRKNFVLILDGSGSMKDHGCSGDRSKSAVAKETVIEWSKSVHPDANLGLIVFDKTGFSTRLPLGVGNRDQFRAEVAKVVPQYKTPLTQSLNTAYSMLTEQGRRQLGYGEYTVIIVTDGAANDITALEKSVNTVLANSPVMINTIGFCIAADHSLNRQGRTVYKAADNPEQLRQGLQEVLAESESFDIAGFE